MTMSVKISRDVYDRVKDHAITTNRTIGQTLNEALTIWLDTEGDARTERHSETELEATLAPDSGLFLVHQVQAHYGRA